MCPSLGQALAALSRFTPILLPNRPLRHPSPTPRIGSLRGVHALHDSAVPSFLCAIPGGLLLMLLNPDRLNVGLSLTVTFLVSGCDMIWYSTALTEAHVAQFRLHGPTEKAGHLAPSARHAAHAITTSQPIGANSELMEEPRITLVEPDSLSTRSQGLEDPNLVYYVNGMLTSELAALYEANALANHLGRPVGLIYNRTSGNMAEDALQAVYDRSWPTVFNEKLGTKANQITQRNRTTRQLTHLLVHTQRDHISIVTHSQGCLIMHNAVLTARRFRDSGALAKGIRWVATGVPLHDEEIRVRINRYTPLANTNDPVAKILGSLTLNLDEIIPSLSGHDFVSAYVPKIRNSQLW